MVKLILLTFFACIWLVQIQVFVSCAPTLTRFHAVDQEALTTIDKALNVEANNSISIFVKRAGVLSSVKGLLGGKKGSSKKAPVAKGAPAAKPPPQRSFGKSGKQPKYNDSHFGSTPGEVAGFDF